MSTPSAPLPPQGATSTDWYDWATDIDGNVDVLLSGGGGTIRKAALHLSGAGAFDAVALTLIAVRTPIRVPRTTIRWRVAVSNDNVRENIGTGGAIGVSGVWFAPAAFDALGAITSSCTKAPVQVMPAGTTPAASATPNRLVGPWIEAPADQLVEGVTYHVSYHITANNIPVVKDSGFGWYATTGDPATNAAAQAGTWAGFADDPFGDVEIEYETAPTDAPVLMVLGDSLSDGWRAQYGVHSAWPTVFGQLTGVIPVLNTYARATLANFGTAAHRKYTRYAGLSVDAVHIALGANDVNVLTLAQMQAGFANVLTAVRATWGSLVPIHASTVPPSTIYSAGGQTTRTAYNNWLRTQPHGVAGTVDFDRVLRSTANIQALDPEYAHTDAQHITSAGHAAQAVLMPAVNRRAL